MIESCVRLILDVRQTSMPITVNTKRGDTGRKLLITLSDGGVPYSISEDCSAVFTAKKPDGTALFNQCSIENNEICYAFTEQTCAVAGKIPAEIRIYGNNNKLITSASFALEVHDTVCHEDDVISSDEMNALDALMLETEALKNEIQRKLDNGEFVGEPGPRGPKGESGTVLFEDLTEEQIATLKGDKGEKGDDGTGVNILGSCNTYEELIASHPTGNIGDAYMIDGQLHIWSESENTWVNVGNIKGPKGEDGKDGLDGKSAFKYAQDGGYTGSENAFAKKLAAEYLSITGGEMAGPINMNGQPINGLNPPTEDNQAANMGFVNQQVRNASLVNLLVNPNFAKPINQRKIENSWIDGLGIDRWFAYNSAAELRDGYIRIPARGRMVQLVDMGEELAGGTYTIALGRSTSTSIVLVVSSVISVPDELPATDAEFGYAKTGDLKIRMAYSPDDGVYVEINNESATTGYGAVWAGLFPGNIDPNAISRTQAVDYDLELLKCQMDYIRIGAESGNTVLGVAVGYNATGAYFGIPGLGMRTKYTARMVTDISTLKYTESTLGVGSSVTSVAGYNVHNGNAVSMSITGTFTAGKAYSVWLEKGVLEISTGR